MIAQNELSIGDYIKGRLALMGAAAVFLHNTSSAAGASSAPADTLSGEQAIAASLAQAFQRAASTTSPTTSATSARSAPALGESAAAEGGATRHPTNSPFPSNLVINASMVEDIIARAGPEVHNSLFTQSAHPRALPAGISVGYELSNGEVRDIEVTLEIKVSRSRLLPELVELLDRILAGDKNMLMLPLRYVEIYVKICKFAQMKYVR